ncbi:MAG: hypothetical protein M3429_07665 [Verrucomicrobiota bacterium]|nr:hypothetical protein [Verrucomicrobiota bacterium]
MKTPINTRAVAILSFCFASTGFAADDKMSPIKVPALAPHPFYFADAGQRTDMVAFLRSLDTGE